MFDAGNWIACLVAAGSGPACYVPILLLQDLWLPHTPYCNDITPVISLQRQQECAGSYHTTTIIPMPRAVPSANSAIHVSRAKSFNLCLPSMLSLSP